MSYPFLGLLMFCSASPYWKPRPSAWSLRSAPEEAFVPPFLLASCAGSPHASVTGCCLSSPHWLHYTSFEGRDHLLYALQIFPPLYSGQCYTRTGGSRFLSVTCDPQLQNRQWWEARLSAHLLCPCVHVRLRRSQNFVHILIFLLYIVYVMPLITCH